MFQFKLKGFFLVIGSNVPLRMFKLIFGKDVMS